MTKWEAAKELEQVMDIWLDFDYWAYCQLEMRGEWSNERMSEVIENHERAERALIEYREQTDREADRMETAGATGPEIQAYFNSRHPEQWKLLCAWRSLDGLPEGA